MKKDETWVLPSLGEARKRTLNSSEIKHDIFMLTEEQKTIGKGRTFFVRTYGCLANERDSETIAGILTDMGFSKADEITSADVIVLNTCAIRQNAENKVLGEIGYFKHQKKKNPNFVLCVCGCMAQEESVVNMLISEYPQVDIIFGTHNIHSFPNLLTRRINSNKRAIEVLSKEGDVVENLPVVRNGKYKASVDIMYGCNKFCTYCIVPYTRGKERSRNVSDIVNEVKTLVDEGYVEVTLLGQNVNAYGKDLNMEDGFAVLLEEVAKTGIPRIRFQSPYPSEFSDEQIDIMAKYDNIMPALNMPLQSGDDEILKLMGRRYTTEIYKDLITRLKKKIPNITLTTDIIVGFPNESEEQFKHTLDMVDFCEYDNAFTFIYSPREGTPAAKMEDSIPAAEKEERLQRLNAKIKGYSSTKMHTFQDKILEVLCDGPSKTNDQVMSGYSRENKLVNFIPLENTKEGDVVKVLITDCKAFSLDGKQIEE